ncbi:MAG: ATP-binding protein, partial [Gaiellaceae bacterium]
LTAPTPAARPRPQTNERPSRGALVGYGQELASLEDLLEQTLVGQGRLALVSGEPGIGKSRLADELATVAQARGAQVVWGRCSTSGGAPAYWPWTQIFRALAAERDPASLRNALGSSGAAELAQLVPDLGDLLADGRAPDPEEGRFRLHDAARTFIARLAAERPLVIVLDDAHAADTSSLSLLEFASGVVMDAPVLILVTYRDTEAALERGLSQTIGELARTTDCLQLVLTGLTEEDTTHFVEVSADLEPMPALAAAIHEATSGNPLFVTELVRLLRTEDRLREIGDRESLALPRGVDQVIARRLERLSDPCHEMLATAAVIGREFDSRLLEQTAGAFSDELLDEAVRARLIDPIAGRATTFRFSHDLVRQTLHGGLTTADRRRLHAAIGAALEQTEPEPTAAVVASLAYHYAGALPDGDADKAVRYLAAAGDNTADVGASEEAASWYAQAADVARANAVDDHRVSELYMRRAEQLVLVPDPAEARKAIDAAQELAGATPDPSFDVRLEVAAAHLCVLDAAVRSRERIEGAIEFFQEIDDPAGEARAWDALATLHCGYSEKTREGDAGRRMLEAARRAGNRGLVSRAMGAIAASLASGTTPVSEAISRVNKLGDEAGDPIIRARLKTSLSVLYGASGRFDDARAALAEAAALAPPSYDATSITSWAARLELVARNYRRAEELARELCAYYRARDLIGYLTSEQMFVVDALVGQGRLTEAAVELESAPTPAPDDTDALFRQARSRAALALARGELDAAEEHARASAAYTDGFEVPDEHCQTLLVLARVLIAQERDAEAREVIEEILAYSARRENVVFENRARELLATTERMAGAA